MGHSMGGHGALTIALKNPDTFARPCRRSRPSSHPIAGPVGREGVFGRYLGDRTGQPWADYDATALVRRRHARLAGERS